MIVLLSQIPQGHGHLERTEPAEVYELGEWLRPQGGVRVDLDTDRRGQQITLRGAVVVTGLHQCARCLREVSGGMEAELLVLADRRGSDDPRDEEALEQQGEVLYHEGVELDLRSVIREALILEVPQVILCRPDCRGLCPQCGQDLNEGGCDCTPAGNDPRWDRLRSLKDADPGDAR